MRGRGTRPAIVLGLLTAGCDGGDAPSPPTAVAEVAAVPDGPGDGVVSPQGYTNAFLGFGLGFDEAWAVRNDAFEKAGLRPDAERGGLLLLVRPGPDAEAGGGAPGQLTVTYQRCPGVTDPTAWLRSEFARSDGASDATVMYDEVEIGGRILGRRAFATRDFGGGAISCPPFPPPRR